MTNGEVDDLKSVAVQLGQQVKNLTKVIADLLARTQRTERRSRVMVGVVIFDVFFTATVSALIFYQYQTASQLAKTRAEVLCPLYSVIVGSYAPQTRAAGPDREAYERVFAVMRPAYGSLDCSLPPVAPRLPSSR